MAPISQCREQRNGHARSTPKQALTPHSPCHKITGIEPYFIQKFRSWWQVSNQGVKGRSTAGFRDFTIMAAQIISFADFKSRRTAPAQALRSEPAMLDGAADIAERFHFWSGASGRRYVHTIYSLVECPAIPAGNYILVHRDAHDRQLVLAVGRVGHSAASLNLAEIRRRGAELGANEVHVHLLAPNAKLSRLIETDLRSGQCSGIVASLAAGM
jgi:hypothetical protein